MNSSIRMCIQSILIVTGFFVVCSPVFAGSPSFSLTNVQATAVTATSTTITWTTSVPTTSQVIVSDQNIGRESTFSYFYQPLARYPYIQDNALVTNHSVTLPNLIPNTTYKYYVASYNASGNLGTSADFLAYIYDMTEASQNSYSTFSTNPINSASSLSFRMDTVGGHNVFAGSNLYFGYTARALAGNFPTPSPSTNFLIPIYSISGLPSGVTAHVICTTLNPTNEVDDSYVVNGKETCYTGPIINRGSIRLKTSASTPPGNYTATITSKATSDPASAQYVFTYDFTVQAQPSAIVKQTVSSIPPIPDLARWESTMLTLGQQWCDWVPANTPLFFGITQQVWFYDGGRAFLQIGDYTGNQTYWSSCASSVIRQYADYVNSANGAIAGYKQFPHGMLMHYLRYRDSASYQGVVNLYNYVSDASLNGSRATSGELSDPNSIRELAYAVNNLVAGEQIGLPRSPYLPIAVDGLLSQIDLLTNSANGVPHQPFWDGLASESLINYYTLTGDVRIPVVIKRLLDWHWANTLGSGSQAGWIVYNPYQVPKTYLSGLNNLLVPAFAWYWSISGDPIYQQRGDLVFQHALDQDISYYGKEFSQNYKWSFDYVRWRSGNPLGAADPRDVFNQQDVTGPVISGVSAYNNSSNENIYWTTNESATSQVEYGLTTSYGQTSLLNNTYVTSHSVFLTGLTVGVTYNYRIKSRDMAGNLTTSSNQVFTTSSSAVWYNSSWSYRKLVTIDRAKVSGSNSLTNFPVLVSVTDAQLTNAGKADGADFVFVNSLGVKLNHEIESFDRSTGQLQAWVLIPSLSSSVDTTMYIYYGNSGATDQQNKNATWNTNYKGVWHLGSGVSISGSDSTVNNNHGVVNGATATVGKIGTAAAFNGSSSINVPYSSTHNFAGPVSLGMWIYQATTATPRENGIFIRGAYELGLGTYTNSPSNINLQTGGTNYGQISVAPLALVPGQWNHIALVNVSGGVSYVYINGEQSGNVNGGGNALSGGAITIGVSSLGSTKMLGNIDEVRLSNVTRTAGWIKTEYNNQSNPSTFISVGSAESYQSATPTDTTPPVISGIGVSNITSSTLTLSWSTNESSDTQAEYGLTSSYGSVSALNTSFTQLHTVIFSSLSPNTTYHFRVRSRDASGNLAVSSNQTFTTTNTTIPTTTPTAPTPATNSSAVTQSQITVPAGSRPIKRNIKNTFDSSKTCGTFQNSSTDYGDCLEYALNPQLIWSAFDPVETSLVATTTKTTTLVVVPKTQNTSTTQTKALPKTVYFGQSNADVVTLQDILKKLGYFPKTLKSSGYFGSTTRKSVQAFQRAYGIVSKGTEATTGYGMVGKITWKKLLEVGGN